MKITIEALKDFLECPRKYYYRHIKKEEWLFLNGGEKNNPKGLEEKFEQDLHKVFYYLFHSIQDNKYPSIYLLRKRWGTLWCKEKTIEDVLLNTSKHVLMRRKEVEADVEKLELLGVDAIDKMHQFFDKKHGVPLLVGKRVNVKIGHHEVDTIIDLVRETEKDGKKIIEVMDFRSDIKLRQYAHQRPLDLHIDHDIGLTLASLGFYQLTHVEPKNLTYYLVLRNGTYSTQRTKHQYQELYQILNMVEKAIQNEIYYPVYHAHCYDCPFSHLCQKGKEVTSNDENCE